MPTPFNEIIPGGAARQIANISGNPEAVGIDPRALHQPAPQQPVSPVSNLPAQWQNAPQQSPAPQEEPPAPKSKLESFREQYPAYDKIADEELLYKLWNKNYKDKVSIEEFHTRMGYDPVEDTTARDTGRMITQGATVGFGDEATAALGATIAKIASLAPGEQAGEDSTFGDIYRDILQTERDEIGRYREDHPAQALAYEVAGGLATGGVGALRTAGTTLATKTAIGSAWGGAYGAGAADPDIDKGGLESLGERAVGGAKGAALGAVVTPPLVGAGKAIGAGYRATQRARIEKRLATQEKRFKLFDDIQNDIYTARAMGTAPPQAKEAAFNKVGISERRMLEIEAERGKLLESAGVSQKQAQDILVANQFVRKVGLQSGAMKLMDDVIEPIATRIEKHSPIIATQLRRFEAKLYSDVHEWHDELSPYIDRVRKQLSKADKAEYGKFMYNRDFASAKQLLLTKTKGIPTEIGQEFDNAMSVIRRIGQDMKDQGAKFDDVPNYYPRRIKDIIGLKKALGQEDPKFMSGFAMWEKALKDKGGHREGTALNAYMRGTLKTKVKETALRSRKVKEVNDNLYQYYEDPIASLDLFLRDAASQINRRKLLGQKNIVEDAKTGVEDISGGIDKLIGSFGQLSTESKQEVADLLKARFGPGDKGMIPIISNIRAIGHNSLLGDAVSAATQLGDIGVSSWVNGFMPSMRSLFGKKQITANDLGIMRELVAEMSDPGSMQRVSDKIFRWSGFKSVDKLGKDVAINSTLIKYKRLANSYTGKKQLTKDLSEAWGDDTTQLITELEAGKPTDLVKQFLFCKLSEMQPISRSEMPQKFLENPNGRIAYQLATWTMKQFSLFRNTAYADIRSGNAKRTAKGLKNALTAATMIGGANIVSDEAKRFMTGRDSALIPTMENGTPADLALKLVTSTFKNFTGLSEYSAGKMGSISVPTATVGWKVGKSIYDAGGEIAQTGEWGEKSDKAFQNTVRQVPLVGKMAYYWLLGGAEEFNKKEEAKQFAARYKHLGM